MDVELVSLWIQGAIGIAAFLALLQITQSKRSFRLNSKRDSIKYSSELVKEYVERAIPLQNETDKLLNQLGFKKYSGEFNLKHFSKKEIFDQGGSLKNICYMPILLFSLSRATIR